MDAKHIVRNSIVALILLFLCGAIAAVVFVHTGAFRSLLRSEIGTLAFEHAGARVEIGSITIQWIHLGADVHDIAVYGANDKIALLQAQRFEVGVRWLPLLHKRVELSTLRLDKPVIRIAIDAQGRSNLPKPPHPASGSGPDTIFDLAIGAFEIHSGQLYYNDVQTPVEADLHDLQLDVRYSLLKDQYAGSLSYDDGRLVSKSFRLNDHAVRMQFAATRSALSVSPLQINSGSSRITVCASLTNYAGPSITGTYTGSLAIPELAIAIDEPALPTGDIALDGSFSYKQLSNGAFLDAVDVQGKLSSGKLQFDTAEKPIEAAKLAAAYQLTGGNLYVRNLSANLLGARADANFDMLHIDAPRTASRMDASLAGLSLRAVSNTLAPPDVRRIPFVGTAGISIHASWSDSIKDATVTARLSVTSHPQPAESSRASIPVNGLIQADYEGSKGTLAFGQSYLQTANTKLSLTGTLKPQNGASSQLAVSATTNDLGELTSLIELVQNAMRPAGNPSTFPKLAGNAKLTAQISGAARSPSIQGRLTAQNLVVGPSRWRSLALDLSASSQHLNVSDGTLLGDQRQQIIFAGAVGLHDWGLAKDSPISVQASVSNTSVTDIQEIANLHYPLSGTLDAKVSINGTRESPEGAAMITLAKASAYGEPINKLTLDANSHNSTVSSTINLQIPAGTIAANATYSLRSQQYTLRLTGTGIALGKIAALQPDQALEGVANLSASGAGTIYNPQLNAQLTIPQLQIHGQTISNIAATVSLADQRADMRLNSTVDQGGVDAKATVQLTGDDYTAASLDITSLPIAAVAASFIPGQSSRLTGQLEAHLAVSGPLKMPRQMQVNLQIPAFSALYDKVQLALIEPLSADYRNGRLTVNPTQIQGPGTKLTLGGSMSLTGGAVYALTADGSVDLGVVQQFVPQVRSSGQLEVHIHSSGSPSQPSMQGQLQVKDAVFTTETLPVSIEGINAQINVNGTRADIANFSGTIGGGSVSAQGYATVGRQTTFNLGLSANSVRVRYPAGLRSVLSAQLRFSGMPTGSTLSGTVLINSLSFTQQFDLSTFAGSFSEDSAGAPPSVFENNMKFALAVQSSQGINLASNKLSIGGSANLNVTGTMANPVVLGRIALTSGEVFFLGKRFEIQSGTIAFADPVRTNPVISMYVTTTIEQYNITLNLNGPVDRLRTNYTSEPALPPVDIIHLLAFGNTTEEAAAQPSQSAAMGAESVVAQGVTSQLAGKLENLTGISQLTIDPLATNAQGNTGATIAIQERVTGNILLTFSTDVTETQDQTVEVQYLINKRVSVTVLRDQNGGYGIDVRIHKIF